MVEGLTLSSTLIYRHLWKIPVCIQSFSFPKRGVNFLTVEADSPDIHTITLVSLFVV
jgi:hypothetical protein